MNKQRLIDTAKSWINPPHPGRGKSAIIGFLLGFFLGVFGVGIYLRSLVEFAPCTILVAIISPFASDFNELLIPAVCGLWVVVRILWDNRTWPRAGSVARGASTTTGSTSINAATPVPVL